MTISSLASLVGMSWDTTKEIIHEHLEKLSRKRSWRDVRFIAIDEISVKKHHKYMTVVMDLEDGRVLYVAEGTEHTCLKACFQRLRKAHAKLKAIAVDMSSSYQKAIRLYAPSSTKVVHDRFHLVANMNGVIDEVRRNEQNRAITIYSKKAIKGTRYLLLYGIEKIEKMADEPRLKYLLRMNETLNSVYLLKEEFRQFWEQSVRQEAKALIRSWVKEAKSLGLQPLTIFANTIEKNAEKILNWYDYKISTGPLEGTNNKIKVLKRQAYGYRDFDFFSLRVLFIKNAKRRLIGV
jgi:transposase